MHVVACCSTSKPKPKKMCHHLAPHPQTDEDGTTKAAADATTATAAAATASGGSGGAKAGAVPDCLSRSNSLVCGGQT